MSNNIQASSTSQTPDGTNTRITSENRIQNSTVVGNSKFAMPICNKAVNSLGQTVTVRPIRASICASDLNTLRPVAIVPPEISKTPARIQPPDMEHLNEQIKQAKKQMQLHRQPVEKLKFQQNNAQRQHSNIAQHSVQNPSNNPARRSTTANSVQQKTQQISVSSQKQQMQQKSSMVTSPPSSTEHNMHVSSTSMEVDPLECVQEKIHVIQQVSSPQSEHESSSNESVAYLQKIINDPSTAIVQHQIKGSEAKMLVILISGEQRLITFEIPKEDCTVHDLLDQVRAVLGQVCLYVLKICTFEKQYKMVNKLQCN